MRCTRKKIAFLSLALLFMLIAMPMVYAGEIKLSTNQSEYYFTVKESAVIPLEITNTHGKKIDGMLTTSLAQKIDQPGYSYSGLNSQSRSFSIAPGKSMIQLGFGAADTPLLLKIDLSFAYDTFKVELKDIIIHYVAQQEQKQENNEQKESSSRQAEQQKIAQDLQEKFRQMFSPQQQQRPSAGQQQQKQNELQNNQLSQDSSALKKQMEQDMAAQDRLKQEFQQELSQNGQFIEKHQQMLDQGYQMKNADLQPTEKNCGNFNIDYENQRGEAGNIKGIMENSTITNMQKINEDDKRTMLNRLGNDERFRQYEEQLKNEGFERRSSEFTQEQNKTIAQINYANPQNQTAAISADIIDNEIKNVELKREHNYYVWLLGLLALSGIGYYIYTKYFAKKPETDIGLQQATPEPDFDYVLEAKKLLEESKALFAKQMYKDAYGKAGQSLRMYLSYKHGMNKEVTNDEIIRYFMFKNKDHAPYKDCFDLCSMVEFAKYQPNGEDFGKITGFVDRTLK